MKIKIEYKELEKFKYYCYKHNINILEIIYENNIVCKIQLTNEEKEKLIGKEQNDIRILEYAVLEEKYIKIKNES